ncbi:DNA repair RAD51 homolog 4 isoform X1 [Pelobates cultripes]|uniref:DNA repair protein RAD51 homolog 4 n=1 Tax=Pelobates cultripes TaxID=61616 RepID=A0AAD1R3N8_PELCU|nr:DNA repair RAD51 homolog 4 isoform X1 [Pelobates cultripes]
MVILREGLCPGLTADIIGALKTNNVKTVVDLVASDLEELAQKCSLSYKTLVAVRRVLLARYSAFPTNAADLYEELKGSTAILPTGNHKLDFLLDSGLYTGEVTEITGAAGNGKTQVCHSIAVNVAYGLKQSVLYIDTTGGLTASRLLQLVQSRTEQEAEQIAALQRIEIIHVFDVYKLLDLLQDLRCNISQQLLRSGEPLRLVIIDSVCAVIYPILGGKQTEGMAIMMYLAKELQMLAHDFKLAVLTTNHVTKDGFNGIRPALGRSWSFVPSTRILLERPERSLESEHRIASLIKSPRLPTNLQVEVQVGCFGTLDEIKPVSASAL